MLVSLLGLETPSPSDFHSDDLLGATVNLLKSTPIIGDSVSPLIATAHSLPIVGEDVRFVTSTLHTVLPGAILLDDLVTSVFALPAVGEVVAIAEVAEMLLLQSVTGPAGLVPNLLAPTGLLALVESGISDIPLLGDLLLTQNPLPIAFSDSFIGYTLSADGYVGSLLVEYGPVGLTLSALIGPEGVVTGATQLLTDTVDNLPVVNYLAEHGILGTLLGGFLGGKPLLGTFNISGDLLTGETNLAEHLIGQLTFGLIGDGGLLGNLAPLNPILEPVSDLLGNITDQITGTLGILENLLGGLPIVGNLTNFDDNTSVSINTAMDTSVTLDTFLGVSAQASVDASANAEANLLLGQLISQNNPTTILIGSDSLFGNLI